MQQRWGLRRWIAGLVGSRKSASPPDYKTWWNTASEDRAGAYATTYVTDDETDYRSRGLNGDANTFGAKQLIEMAHLDRTSRVLEIGCGAARVGREFASHVAEWHGADISENMLAFARQRTAGISNVHLHTLASVGLPGFAGESFDFVYCTTVFMHLDKEDLFEYLLESRRVLRPRGYAFFDTWNLLHPDTYRQWRSNQRANTGFTKSRGRIQFCTAPELRLYLEDAGFEILRLDEDKLLRAFCRKAETTALVRGDGLPPFGCVDGPRNEGTIEGPLSVWGWALDAVRSIEVRLDLSTSLGSAALGDPRPDVAPLFPRYPGAAACGYHLEIPAERLPPGHHTLQVIATDEDGRQTDLAGIYRAFNVGR